MSIDPRAIYVAPYFATGFHSEFTKPEGAKQRRKQIPAPDALTPRFNLDRKTDNSNPTTGIWARFILPLKSFVNKNLRDERFKL